MQKICHDWREVDLTSILLEITTPTTTFDPRKMEAAGSENYKALYASLLVQYTSLKSDR